VLRTKAPIRTPVLLTSILPNGSELMSTSRLGVSTLSFMFSGQSQARDAAGGSHPTGGLLEEVPTGWIAALGRAQILRLRILSAVRLALAVDAHGVSPHRAEGGPANTSGEEARAGLRELDPQMGCRPRTTLFRHAFRIGGTPHF
jgi:hypothetical protein